MFKHLTEVIDTRCYNVADDTLAIVYELANGERIVLDTFSVN